ncbi:SEL1-like repeat protein [Polycladidibacter hongkongensis]|uniref:SEL1-like repeat protein n=1 Tax=Polycladidibacter hongkongensis TaxID=1647556 RepID=UPI00082C2501|nr:SEL1-like repeat protein [Pseudovibrio hongkongensis]
MTSRSNRQQRSTKELLLEALRLGDQTDTRAPALDEAFATSDPQVNSLLSALRQRSAPARDSLAGTRASTSSQLDEIASALESLLDNPAPAQQHSATAYAPAHPYSDTQHHGVQSEAKTTFDPMAKRRAETPRNQRLYSQLPEQHEAYPVPRRYSSISEEIRQPSLKPDAAHTTREQGSDPLQELDTLIARLEKNKQGRVKAGKLRGKLQDLREQLEPAHTAQSVEQLKDEYDATTQRLEVIARERVDPAIQELLEKRLDELSLLVSELPQAGQLIAMESRLQHLQERLEYVAARADTQALEHLHNDVQQLEKTITGMNPEPLLGEIDKRLRFLTQRMDELEHFTAMQRDIQTRLVRVEQQLPAEGTLERICSHMSTLSNHLEERDGSYEAVQRAEARLLQDLNGIRDQLNRIERTPASVSSHRDDFAALESRLDQFTQHLEQMEAKLAGVSAKDEMQVELLQQLAGKLDRLEQTNIAALSNQVEPELLLKISAELQRVSAKIDQLPTTQELQGQIDNVVAALANPRGFEEDGALERIEMQVRALADMVEAGNANIELLGVQSAAASEKSVQATAAIQVVDSALGGLQADMQALKLMAQSDSEEPHQLDNMEAMLQRIVTHLDELEAAEAADASHAGAPDLADLGQIGQEHEKFVGDSQVRNIIAALTKHKAGESEEETQSAAPQEQQAALEPGEAALQQMASFVETPSTHTTALSAEDQTGPLYEQPQEEQSQALEHQASEQQLQEPTASTYAADQEHTDEERAAIDPVLDQQTPDMSQAAALDTAADLKALGATGDVAGFAIEETNALVEMGAASPRLDEQSAAEARAEADRKAEYIAAARRAAQAAAAEVAASRERELPEHEEEEEDGQKKRRARRLSDYLKRKEEPTPEHIAIPDGFLRRKDEAAPSEAADEDEGDDTKPTKFGRRKAVLLTTAALLIAMGTMQVFGVFGSDTDVSATLGNTLSPRAMDTPQSALPEEKQFGAATGIFPAELLAGNWQSVTPALQRPSLQGTTAFAQAAANRQAHFAVAKAEVNPQQETYKQLVAALPQSAKGADLSAALESKDPLAQFQIGLWYSSGTNLPKDDSAAATWYSYAAEGGLAVAQYRLASSYERGLGLVRDIEAAEFWYSASAKQGNIKAMHNLAVMYASGTKGEPDFDRAAYWFQLAAEAGNKDSQFNLAMLYARGLGKVQDLVASYKWFALAGAAGDQEAQAKRAEIAKLLTAQQLSNAKRQTSSFQRNSANESANVPQLPRTWVAQLS